MERLTINLKDTPLPLQANQEVSLAVTALVRRPETTLAVGEEEHPRPIERPGDPNFALGTKAEVVPDARDANIHRLIIHTTTTRDFKQLLSPVGIDIGDPLGMATKL